MNNYTGSALTEKATGNTYRSRQILCIETGTIYGSVTEAADQLKISIAAISKNALREDGSKTKGYSFKFVN